MRMTCLPMVISLIAPIAFTVATSPVISADVGKVFPVSIDNCGTSTTYTDAPKRAFTMNQAATEIMLALGLHEHMAGTAFLDDAILPGFAGAYDTIGVRVAAYPTREVLLGTRSDFVYAAYASGISDEVAGMSELLGSGTPSYLSPSSCREKAGTSLEPMALVFEEIRDIGRIFGVLPRAEQLIAKYRAELTEVRHQLGAVTTPLRVFLWDSGMPPHAAACCGVPNQILQFAGGQNIFDDVDGQWRTVAWKDVVARNPEVIVLVDASWSPAAQKRGWLLENSAFAGIDAVKHRRFVTIDFSDATPGIRNVAAVRKIAAALYPERFISGEARTTPK